MSLENANPTIYEKAKEREKSAYDIDNEFEDEIDDREVFDIL